VNYYNEWDSFAAEWLKQLIKDGLIPDGEVDSRSIADVRPEDLKGFTQCHFFAGIGGWSRALQLAGWSQDRPVWTGSPPCQSFSTAGSRKGKDDERHLWPVFFDLIRECQPPTVFGEQVAAAIRFGWLDDLQNDFEAEGYASGAFVLPSGSIGAYHKRDRLFFTAKRMADCGERCGGNGEAEEKGQSSDTNERQFRGHSINERPQGRIQGREDSQREDINGHTGCSGSTLWSDSTIIYCRDGKYRPIPTQPEVFPLAHGISNRVGILRGAGNAIVPQAAAEIIKAVM
jgi:DNA (cytosine-5)-methyltransferase 1